MHRSQEKYKQRPKRSENKGLKKKGSRTLTVDDVVYRWKIRVDKHSIYCPCSMNEYNVRYLLIEKNEHPGQRLSVFIGGEGFYGDDVECYYEQAFCIPNEKVLSLKDLCCVKISKGKIDHKVKKLPQDLQEYIDGLTKVLERRTNVPLAIQITPRMIRTVILAARMLGWDPTKHNLEHFRVPFSRLYLQSKADLEHKIANTPSLHPYINNLQITS